MEWRKKILNKYLSRFKVVFLEKLTISVNCSFLNIITAIHYKTALIFFFILSQGFLNLSIIDILVR